jgi:hypothetical protein
MTHQTEAQIFETRDHNHATCDLMPGASCSKGDTLC